jgi:hypothetical protein
MERAEAALNICEEIEDPRVAELRGNLEEWQGEKGK